MAEQQYEVGVRLKGDGSGLVGETRAGTDAMRQLEDQAKRTSTALQESARAQGANRTEGTAVKQVLDAQREAAGALTREMGAMTSGTLAASAAAAGLRGVLSGMLSVIGGPIGIIALLGSAALAWSSFGSAATEAADDVEKAAQKSQRSVQGMAALLDLQARSDALYAESRQISERVQSRQSAAEARAAGTIPGRMHRSLGGVGVNVTVNPADETDAARLAAVNEQLRALQEQIGKWAPPEWQPPAAKDPKGETTYSRWADQDLARAAAAARAEFAAIGAEIKKMEDGAQAFNTAAMQPLVQSAQELDNYWQTLVTSSDKFGNTVTMTKREFDALGESARRAELEQQRAMERELERAAAVQQRLADNLERSITDATVQGLIAGFRRGEDVVQNFIRRLEEAFLSAVLTPIIQPIVRPIAMAAAGIGQGIANSIFGGGSASAGGTSMGGLGFAGIGSGSQLVADFGNYFGNIGAITESGATFGFTDALGGFVGSNPWLPYAGAGLQLMQGDVQGAALSAGLTYAGGAMFGPPGAVAGAVLGGILGGGGDGDAQRTGRFVQPFGEARAWPTVDERWFSGSEMGASLASFGSSVAAQEQNLMRNLNLSPEQIASVQGALESQAFGRSYGFGMEHTDWTQSGAPQQILADRLQAISSALGRSIEELTQVMSMSAEQWQQFIEAMQASVAQAELVLGQHVRSLPGRLGITALEGYERSLAIAEFNAPLDRLGAARESFDEMLARARGGDLDAVNALPRYAQDLLGIGRESYASGAEFQDVLGYVERSIAEVRGSQEDLLADITKDVSVTLIETSRDQIGEIRKQTTTLAEKLDEVKRELERLRAGG